MKKIIAVLLIAVMALSFSACGNNTPSTDSSSQPESSTPTSNPASDGTNSVTDTESDSQTSDPSANPTVESNNSSDETESGSNILVAFFSRTGENYGVGMIEKGNTHIIADMIADEMDADTFEIARVTPYPEDYNSCTDEAKQEQNENARPELTSTVDNFEDYDIIFLGYPNWWGDMPMPVYTFLESYDFSGKTVIPFCTHAGSGLSGTVQTLKDNLTGATVLDGLAIAGTTAQNNQSEAQKAVSDWLDGLSIKE